MNCESVRENLSAYLDGELEPELRTHIDAHLADCPICRAELEALTRTARLIGSLPKVRAPGSVLAEVESHLERGALLARSEPEPARPSRFGFLKALSGLAAAAALLLVAYVAWQSTGRVSETTVATRDTLKSGSGATEKAKTVAADKSRRGTVYQHTVDERFFYVDDDSSGKFLADDADEVHIVLAAADFDDARKLIQAAVAELTLQDGYVATAADAELLARRKTPVRKKALLDDTLKRAAKASETTAEETPADRKDRVLRSRAALREPEPSKVEEKARRELRSETPAPAVVPEAEKQGADVKETLDKLSAAEETLQEGAKPQEPVVVLTVPADQLDALLARLSGMKGLTVKSPTPGRTSSFGVTSSELDRTRGGRTAGKRRAKSGVTPTPTTKGGVPGEKGRANLVRVVIYLEAIEAADLTTDPAPTP